MNQPSSQQQRQSQSARGTQSQQQSSSADTTQDAKGSHVPGEDPGTLNDFDYVGTGGPDALDAVTHDEHPDSPSDAPAQQAEDPERSGGQEDRSQQL